MIFLRIPEFGFTWRTTSFSGWKQATLSVCESEKRAKMLNA